MSLFKIAESITGRNEGGYANNKADKGGETFAGIARKFWPNWLGWRFIDQFKADYTKAKTKLTLAQWVNASAKSVPQLLELISTFYKSNFWDINKLDLINDQQLANTIYDFSVNSGEERAADFMQTACNKIGKLKLSVDGDFGNKTIAAINSLSAPVLHAEYNAMRKEFYLSIAHGDQKQFLSSWLSRLKSYKA